MGEKKYYITDMESGIPFEVTKEQKEKYIQFVNSFKVKSLDGSNLGKPILFGTGGEIDEGNFKKLWKK